VASQLGNWRYVVAFLSGVAFSVVARAVSRAPACACCCSHWPCC